MEAGKNNRGFPRADCFALGQNSARWAMSRAAARTSGGLNTSAERAYRYPLSKPHLRAASAACDAVFEGRFSRVLRWPLVTGRPAAAVADEPPPYYDCQGNALTPEEFDALVERLAEIAAGYGQVFSVPFGYCDEGPLVIEGLPAECAFSQGWRNYLSDSPEAFLLEPLDVVLFTIDELIAGGLQIDPVVAQEMRAHNFRIGYLAGVVQSPLGEAGFYGRIISAADQSGVWSVWAPVGVLSAPATAALRAIRNCTGGGRQSVGGTIVKPGYEHCAAAYELCVASAGRTYSNAVLGPDTTYRACLVTAFGTGTWGTFWGCVKLCRRVRFLPACLKLCPLIAPIGGVFAAYYGCELAREALMSSANTAYLNALGDCQAARIMCEARPPRHAAGFSPGPRATGDGPQVQ